MNEENNLNQESEPQSENPQMEILESDKIEESVKLNDSSISPEIREQATQLLRQVQVARLRNQPTIADKLLEEAVALAPNFSQVQEAIGDDLVVRKQFRKAKEAYLRAHQLDKNNKEIENKYGEMVLKVDLFIDPFVQAEADSGTLASGKAAVLLNLIFPGVGHMVIGRYVFGGILLAVWFVCMLIAFGTPDGMKSFLGSLGIGPKGLPVPPLVPVALFGVVICWLTGIVSAASQAKTFTPKTVVRPEPLSPHKFD